MSRWSKIIIILILIPYVIPAWYLIGTLQSHNTGEWIGYWQSERYGDGGEIKLNVLQNGNNIILEFDAQHHEIFKADFTIKISPNKNGLFSGETLVDIEMFTFSGWVQPNIIVLTWGSTSDKGYLVATKDKNFHLKNKK